MHGFDLLKELKKRGIEVDNVRQEVEVPALKDLVTTLKDLVTTLPAKDVGTEVPAFRRIDFSKLADRSDALLMLLSDKPPFATQGNFKEGYVAELRRVRKNVQRFFTGKLGREEMFSVASSKLPESIGVDDTISLCFDYRYDWTIEGKVAYNERTLPHAPVGQGCGGSTVAPIVGQELPGALDARLHRCTSQRAGGGTRRTRSGFARQGEIYGTFRSKTRGASGGVAGIVFPWDVGQILVGQLRPYAAPPVLLQGRTHALRRSGRKRDTRRHPLVDGFLYPDGIGLPPCVQRGREPQGRFQPAHRRGGQAKTGAADRTPMRSVGFAGIRP